MKKALTAVVSLGLASALLTGCSSDPNNVSYGSISNNLTPELRGLTDRPIDIDRHNKVTANTNSRMFWDDISRWWYTDHPSRLSPYPVGYSSGQPR